MAKYSEEVRNRKMAHAKNLFAKGYGYEVISDIMEIPVSTLKKWGKEGGFMDYKQMYAISVRELRGTIIESYNARKNGEMPKLSPREAGIYAKAFNDLSDSRKTVSYFIYAFETLSEYFHEKIADASSCADKERVLSCFKFVRDLTQLIIDSLIAEVVKTEK
jgi:hypothetical protein